MSLKTNSKTADSAPIAVRKYPTSLPVIMEKITITPIDLSFENEYELQNNINKDISIMDVENSTVEKFLTKNQIDLLIHGHTHRPATHIHQCHQRESTRIVLGDWQDTGWCVLLDEQTQELSEFKV